MAQGLSGPQRMGEVTVGRGYGRVYKYTWKGNNFTGRGGRNGHFYGRVLESLKDQFGQSTIFHLLSGPERFQILIPHKAVILMGIVHSGLRILIVDGSKMAA